MTGATCPYCRTAIEPEEETVVCPGCETTHHTDCLAENGGCTVFGCPQSPVEEPKISISDQDLSIPGPPRESPPPPPGSFLRSVPPPPRPRGALPSPVLPSFYPIERLSNDALFELSGYGQPREPVDKSLPRKKRRTYIALGILLGAFGGHNFYAGYVKKAVIQVCVAFFCLVMLSTDSWGWAMAIVGLSWVWAVVDVCTIKSDADRVALA